MPLPERHMPYDCRLSVLYSGCTDCSFESETSVRKQWSRSQSTTVSILNCFHSSSRFSMKKGNCSDVGHPIWMAWSRPRKGWIGYEMPEGKQKLLQFYILVVSLMVTGPEMDYHTTEMLRTEMKLTRKALAERFQSLGAKIIGTLKQGEDGSVRLLKNGKTLNQNLPNMMDGTPKKRKR